MKKQLALGLAMTLCGLGAAVFAGDESGAEKPQMYCIYKEVVKPEKQRQYEDAVKHMISEFRAYQIDPEKVYWHTISGAELGYLYVMPIDGFAGMDQMEAHWNEAIEILGKERWEQIMAPMAEAMESVSISHSIKRKDLSYVPENPRLKQEEIKYVRYGFYYAHPGKGKDFEKIAQKFAELYERKGLDSGWSIYQGVSGADLPVYVVAMGAKSAADYYTNRERILEQLGEEGEKLGEQVGATVRKMEYVEGMLRPDLSYPGPDEHEHAHDEEGHGHKH